jgi:hypothetical protein
MIGSHVALKECPEERFNGVLKTVAAALFQRRRQLVNIAVLFFQRRKKNLLKAKFIEVQLTFVAGNCLWLQV